MVAAARPSPTVFVDLRRLITQNFSCEVAEGLREALRHLELLSVLGSHRLLSTSDEGSGGGGEGGSGGGVE